MFPHSSFLFLPVSLPTTPLEDYLKGYGVEAEEDEKPWETARKREITKRKNKVSIYLSPSHRIAYQGKTPPMKLKALSLTLSARSQSACKEQNGS